MIPSLRAVIPIRQVARAYVRAVNELMNLRNWHGEGEREEKDEGNNRGGESMRASIPHYAR